MAGKTSALQLETSITQPTRDRRNAPRDQVFCNYDSKHAIAYAEHRSLYSPSLYRVLLDHFVSNGGHFNTVIDVGCGTGQVTREIGKWFNHATGADHSQEMIFQARQIGGLTKFGNQIEYEVAGAEELETLHSVKPACVDLLTVGMAVSALHILSTCTFSIVYLNRCLGY
jgi:trans-aconitate 3-methyltransferase